MFSNQEKIGKFFSEQENKLTEKNFLVPSAIEFDLNKEHISKQDYILNIKKTFLSKTIFLISRKLFLL